MLQKLMIPGTFRTVTHQTDQANNVKIDLNGTVVFRDEVPLKFFDEGTGDPEWKEQMTSGKSTTTMCVIDSDTKERKQQVTVSKLQTSERMCTNEPACRLPDPVHSRMYVHDVVRYEDREGKDILTHKARATYRGNDDVEALKTAFYEDMKTIQFLHAIIYMKIFLQQMLPPNMLVATYHMQWYKQYMAEQGIMMKQRDLDRIMLFATSCTIWSAIHCVFFTDMVFAGAAEEFKFEDVHLCQPFMVCTTQIIVFAITQMSDMLVHPQHNIIFKTMLTLDHNYMVAPITQESPSRRVNYNYLTFSFPPPPLGKELLEGLSAALSLKFSHSAIGISQGCSESRPLLTLRNHLVRVEIP
jgi:hypothetical protein